MAATPQRVPRSLQRAVITFLAVTVVGTLGYVLIEGWTAWDAFYMTIISVTTAGYQEVHPLTVPGQAWTVLVLIVGVASLFYTAALVMSEVLEGSLLHRFETRRFNRMLDQLNNHFIICGYGRIGAVIADEFRRHKIPYIVIDRDPDRVHSIIENGGMAVEADSSNEEVLRKVGIDRARGLIAAVGTDAENVYTVLSARVVRPDLFIIARVETEGAEPKLKRAGADRVLSPYQLGGIQMAATALRPAVVDFMRLATSSERIELSAEQITIAARSRFVGQTIRDTNLRRDFDVVVVALKHKTGQMEFNPAPDLALVVGDELVVLGHPDQLKALEAAAAGPAA